MSQPTVMTLALGPSFGAVHWDAAAGEFMKNERGGFILRDENLAGRLILFKPQVPGIKEPRTTFEIGRHPQCWLKIGWAKDLYSGKFREVTDERGYPLMNYFPRISLTFQWMDAEEWNWVGQSAWFVIPGGVFLNKSGVRERSGANLDVYLNNRLISSSGNPEPLFPDGITQTSIAVINRDVHSKFDVPYAGKIIALDKALDRHTTGWPSAIWEGPSWPVLDLPKEAEPKPEALAQNADVEEAITVGKTQDDRPWYALHIEAAWAWYSGKSTLAQLAFMALGSASAALVLWAWSR